MLPADRRIFLTYEALIDGIEWERYGLGERPPLRALRHPLRLRAVGDDRDDLEVKETVRSLAWTLR